MLELDEATRSAIWSRFIRAMEEHRRGLRDRPVTGTFDGALALGPRDALTVIDEVIDALERGLVPTDHPRYFGLFNSAPAALGVLADALVSEYNPQLATRGHAPWPVAVEDCLVAAFGERFGWPPAESFGAFTSGGGEANITAVLCALAHAFPEIGERGVRSLQRQPRLYVSAEGHATVARAARIAGLGADAVRIVGTDACFRIKPHALADAIGRDVASDRPFLVVATAGTTSSGSIDAIAALAEIAKRYHCWLHVDAAWGGLAALVPELRAALAGIEDADSLTFDPHKVMSAPMGTGLFLTRHQGILERVFDDRTGYMTRDSEGDPYKRSMPWSRRFIGLRVLLPLLVIGWEGYQAVLRKQVALAVRLRSALTERGWSIASDTPLPIVCFTDCERTDAAFCEAVARAVIESAGGWVSVPRFSNGTRALRACINNHRTQEQDVDRLVDALAAARRRALAT